MIIIFPPILQFLSDVLEMVFKRFECSYLMNAEYKRRAVSQRVDIDIIFARSIFCVLSQNIGYNDVNYSVLKIEKYDNLLKCFEKVCEITLGDRLFFGVVLLKYKIYVLGGRVYSKCSKSVSDLDVNIRR